GTYAAAAPPACEKHNSCSGASTSRRGIDHQRYASSSVAAEPAHRWSRSRGELMLPLFDEATLEEVFEIHLQQLAGQGGDPDRRPLQRRSGVGGVEQGRRLAEVVGQELNEGRQRVFLRVLRALQEGV